MSQPASQIPAGQVIMSGPQVPTRQQDWSSAAWESWGVTVTHEQDPERNGDDCLIDIEMKKEVIVNNTSTWPIIEQKVHPSETIRVGGWQGYNGNGFPTKPKDPGRYRVEVGVFGRNWSPLYYWNLVYDFTVIDVTSLGSDVVRLPEEDTEWIEIPQEYAFEVERRGNYYIISPADEARGVPVEINESDVRQEGTRISIRRGAKPLSPPVIPLRIRTFSGCAIFNPCLGHPHQNGCTYCTGVLLFCCGGGLVGSCFGIWGC